MMTYEPDPWGPATAAVITRWEGGSDLLQAAAGQIKRALREDARKPYPFVIPRAICAECGHEFAIRLDGTMRGHSTRRGTRRCPGSHRPPAEEDEGY